MISVATTSRPKKKKGPVPRTHQLPSPDTVNPSRLTYEQAHGIRYRELVCSVCRRTLGEIDADDPDEKGSAYLYLDDMSGKPDIIDVICPGCNMSDLKDELPGSPASDRTLRRAGIQ